jgi:autotransporter-associated beta strand protein
VEVSGALRSVAGEILWVGIVSFGAACTVSGLAVESGTTLTFSGTNVVAGAGSLLKSGGGLLEFGGTNANTYAQNTYLNAGTLRLNKQAAVAAIDNGEIFLGDNVGGDNADVLLYATTAGTNQIGDQVIRVAATGLLDLNGVADINNQATVQDVGPTFSGDIVTGAAGVLRLNNSMFSVSQAGLTAASPAPTVQGNIDLQNAARTFDAREGAALVDFDVQAVLQGGGAAGAIAKAGRGTLRISGNNTFTGTTTVNTDSGTLLVNTPDTVAASAYTVNPGSVLGGTGTITGAVTFAAVAATNLTTGGILNPGPNGPAPNNTGILTVKNGLVTFSASSLFLADINGTTPGTGYDQLVISGTGSVSIIGAAGPTQTNTAMIAGTTGNGFQPVNNLDSFKLINNTTGSTITGPPVGSFLSQTLPMPPLSSPSTVVIGGKTYSTTYNVAAGINDGNDFVLQAIAATRFWDGEGNQLATPNNNWSLGVNWVGDAAPFSGDSLVFGDQGDSRESNNNDFVGFSLGTVSLNKTVGGAYNLAGNGVTLDLLAGGITQTGANVTNNAVSLAGITLATNPQTITNASTTALLTINSPINGAQTLDLTGLGSLTFNGAIGGVTPLVAVAATGIDDLTFGSTIATSGNVTQTAGTGLTTLSGGTVGGAVTMTAEAFMLAGSTLTVTGATTLTATVGNIADGNGPANNLTGPSLIATAITGIDLDTTIVDLTATNTGVGNVTIDEANALNILGLSVANGNAVINAGGALTDGATAITSVSGNGRFTGTTITLGEAAGDMFDVGTLTLASAGAVNITENSATQLTGTSAANSLILNSAGALTNAAAASLVVTNNAAVSGTSITLGNQAGDSFTFGSLTFTSAGAVSMAEDDVTNLSGTSTADSLVLSSTGGITNNAAASVTVTNNASLTAPGITLGSAGSDTINFGTLTFLTTVGGIDLTEDSSMDLLGANTAEGPVILTSPDLAGAGQNITLPLGSTLTSNLSSITLTAGDNVTLTGNVSAATTLNVDVDNLALDPAVGGTVTVAGNVTATGGSFFTGHADNDTFTLKPQALSAFTINGNAPTTFPGDVLNLDLTGTVNPLLTLAGLGSGTWTFDPPLLPVIYNSIEQVNATGANYNLILDTNTGGFGNTGVDDEILLRRNGPDFVVERTGQPIAPDNDDVGIIFQGAMATILSFRYVGSNDNDIVTVSDAGGLIDFSSTAPGVPNNPNIAGAAEFSFNGNAGNDRLVFNLVGASVAQNYAIGNGTGATGAEGEIETISGGVTLLSYFQNVELAQRTGSGATPGGLSVLGDLSPNTMSVVANGTATQVTATGYTPFEFTGNNYSGVSASGGQGIDTLELLSIGSGQTNPLATTLNGDAAADTLRVHSTSGNTGVVTLNGGLGNDLFQLFDAANTVNNIAGQVVVDGTDGNIAGNTDTLTIVDSGDTGPDTVLVNPVNPAVSTDYRVEGITSSLAPDDVIFRNIDNLNYTGTQANDIIDARLINTVPVQDLTVVTLNGWLGADQFLLFTSDQAGGSGAGLTPTGTASGVAVINLNGDAPGNPNGADGNDVFGENPPLPFTGTGSGNVGLTVPDTVRSIRPSASTGINIDGGQPTGPAMPTGDTVGDVFNVDISGLPTGSALILPTVSGIVAATGLQPLAYTQIEDINLIYNHTLINVQMGDTLVLGTGGADLIQFMRNSTPTNPNLARVRVNALVVDLTLTGKTLTFGGASNDYITQANVDRPAEIYGEAGDDYISGAMANDFLVGGLGFDQINGSGGDNVIWGDDAPTTAVPNPQDLAIGGDDTLSGLGGNDVFYGGGGNDQISSGGGNDYANGGQGDDLIGGSDGDDRLYGGSGNDVLGGGAGNDLASGGAGDDSLHGNSGNDVLFGGTGTDNISGDDGNDLLVTGSVSIETSSRTSVASVGNYDANIYTNPLDNDAALLSMLAQWASFGTRGTLGTNPPITHDGVNDDVFGGLGDDDFCWEAADIADEFPAVAPPDYNGIGMGADERFGPM